MDSGASQCTQYSESGIRASFAPDCDPAAWIASL